MSKRRTKWQKATAHHEYSVRYIEPEVIPGTPAQESKRTLPTSFTPLLLTPRSLIVTDLLKLLGISVAMLMIEWLLYKNV